MNTATQKERADFVDRLYKAVRDAGYRCTQGEVTKQFNLRGGGIRVTTAAVGRWINGGALPTRDNMRVLAEWLGVPIEWLAYGKEAVDSGELVGKKMSRSEVAMLHDIRAMSEYSRELLYELVKTLIKMDAQRLTVEGAPSARRLKLAGEP